MPNQTAVVHSSSVVFFAIRKGDWKLIEGIGLGGFTEPKQVKPKPDEPTGQLFNLANDPHEDHDLYLKNPEKVKELRATLAEIKKKKKS